MGFLTLSYNLPVMIESEKKLKEFEGKLNSKNSKVISDAIVSLRNIDPFRGAISLLSSHFDSSVDVEIKELISNFLDDLKEPGARAEIVAEIKKAFKQETICMLVSSCWQSGLDYSDFATDFANVFVKGDYLTALECFTVIEESANTISVSVKKEIRKLLESGNVTSGKDKIVLTDALIVVLD
jgi:hypothetical protein